MEQDGLKLVQESLSEPGPHGPRYSTYTEVRLFHDRLRALAEYAGTLGMVAEQAALQDVLFASENGTAETAARVLADKFGPEYDNNVKLLPDPLFPPPGWSQLPGHDKLRNYNHPERAMYRKPAQRRHS